MKHIKEFLLGMYEFKLSYTTHIEDVFHYDKGREFAHRLTFRRFDN